MGGREEYSSSVLRSGNKNHKSRMASDQITLSFSSSFPGTTTPVMDTAASAGRADLTGRKLSGTRLRAQCLPSAGNTRRIAGCFSHSLIFEER
jgi:hypothetical protein